MPDAMKEEVRTAFLDAFTTQVFFFTLPADPTERFRLSAARTDTPGFLLIETFYNEYFIAYGVRQWVTRVSLDLKLKLADLSYSLSKIMA